MVNKWPTSLQDARRGMWSFIYRLSDDGQQYQE